VLHGISTFKLSREATQMEGKKRNWKRETTCGGKARGVVEDMKSLRKAFRRAGLLGEKQNFRSRGTEWRQLKTTRSRGVFKKKKALDREKKGRMGVQ